MANIFDTYDNISVKMALEHAVNTLGALGNVQRDVYKTMISLESHDGPDMYSQYGLEYTQTEKENEDGGKIWVHAVQQNPAKMSPTNKSIMKELTKKFNIDIKVGLVAGIFNQINRLITQTALWGLINPEFFSKKVLSKENVDVINKTLDSLDRELHKIGWEIVTGGDTGMNRLVGIDVLKNPINPQKMGTNYKIVANIYEMISKWKMFKGNAGVQYIGKAAPIFRLSGTILQYIFSGYYNVSMNHLKAFKKRLVYFRDPTLINLSGSNRKYGGVLHPTISCLIKTIKPIDSVKSKGSKVFIKTDPYQHDYYGVYVFQFGKCTFFNESSSAIESLYDPMSLELIKTGYDHMVETGATFTRLFEKTNITWADPEKYGVRKGELKVIKTKLGLNIKVGFISNLLQNFKMATKHLLPFTSQFFTPTFTSKSIEKRENVDLINRSLDEIDRQLRKYGWKVATVDDFEKLGADLFLAQKEHIASMFKGVYFMFWPSFGMSGAVSAAMAPYFTTKKHNIYKNRMVYFRQANVIKGETKFEYGGLMHIRVGCHIISEKPIYSNKHGLHAFDFGKCTMLKSSDSNLD